MSKKLDEIQNNRAIFEEYFTEDLKAIEEELVQSKKYSGIIDKQIDQLSSQMAGINKGSQHYLIEHIANAVQLQTQRQGLRRDRFAIKKAIMDYSSKFAASDDEAGNNDLADLINKLLENDKKVKVSELNVKMQDSSNLENIDKKIDQILDGK